jgi:hypothetical protein
MISSKPLRLVPEQRTDWSCAAGMVEFEKQEAVKEKMPKNSKNSLNNRKGNSFELLDESDGNDSITVQTTSARGRPLKRT